MVLEISKYPQCFLWFFFIFSRFCNDFYSYNWRGTLQIPTYTYFEKVEKKHLPLFNIMFNIVTRIIFRVPESNTKSLRVMARTHIHFFGKKVHNIFESTKCLDKLKRCNFLFCKKITIIFWQTEMFYYYTYYTFL